MPRVTSRFACCAALSVLALASCSLDDRPLHYEYHALEAAGASAGGGSGMLGDSGAPALGDAGSATDDGGGAVAGRGDAGSPPEIGGSANLGGTGGVSGTGASAGAASSASGSGGAPSGGTAGGAAGGAPAGGAGSGGAGGALFPCGDLNHDLVDDCTQTLVKNSRFDSSVAQWDAESGLTEVWGNANATGAPGSGSISLTNNGTGMTGAKQCIPVTPNASYDVAARVQLGAGAGQTSTAGVNVYFYDDGVCHGNLVLSKYTTTPIEGGVAGSWTELATTTPLWVPGSAQSMYVRLVANKPYFQTTPLTVLIDDVLVAKRVMP